MRRLVLTHSLGVLLLGALGAACQPPSGGLHVTVDGPFQAGVDFDRLRVVTARPSGEVLLQQEFRDADLPALPVGLNLLSGPSTPVGTEVAITARIYLRDRLVSQASGNGALKAGAGGLVELALPGEPEPADGGTDGGEPSPDAGSLGEHCESAPDCQSAHCEGGVCCDSACSGPCQSCSLPEAAGHCQLLPDGAETTACGLYLCTGSSAACPTGCGADAGNCLAYAYCSTAGACEVLACDAGTQCTSGFCSDGVCCNAACDEACDACDLTRGLCTSLAPGSTGRPSCAPYVCDGVSATCPTECLNDSVCPGTHFCSGRACVPKLANGTACVSASNCVSGNCVDGYCCNTSCSGPCDVCSAVPGTCSLAAGNAAGNPSCAPYLCSGVSAACPGTCATDSACVSSYYCGGVCIAKRANGASCTGVSQCLSGNCVDGYCCNTSCSGPCDVCSTTPGTCSVLPAGSAGAPSCAPYRCDGAFATCASQCTGDSQCDGAAYCGGGACLVKQTNGSLCSGANQCLSGNCIDGYCCDTACAGACDMCSVPGLTGICSPSVAGTGGVPTCFPYVCDGAATSCVSSCSSSAGCAPGFSCDVTACIAPISLLVDDFNDDSLNSTLWLPPTAPVALGTVAEQNQRLEFSIDAAQTGTLGLFSRAAYDARGGSVTVDTPVTATGIAGLSSHLLLQTPSLQSVGFRYSRGVLYAVKDVGAGIVVIKSTNVATLRKLRLTEGGGKTTWTYSIDGSTFKTLQNAINDPIAMSRVSLGLVQTMTSASATSFTLAFDNVN